MSHEMTNAQYYIYNQHLSNSWELVHFDGETVTMRKNVSTSPHVKSYTYIHILPSGKTRK